MRPIAVLTAIVLGSAAAIAFGLTSSLVVFLILKGRYPQFAAELPTLTRHSAMFLTLAAVAGGALYGLQKERAWRWAMQGTMWLMVLLIGWNAWPTRS